MQNIEQIIKKHSLGNVYEIKPANEFASIGSSGIYIVQTNPDKFIVKLIEPAEKLKERLEYHQTIAPFLPTPKIIASGETYIILSFTEGESLLAKTIKDPANVLSLYELALDLLGFCWQKTNGIICGKRNCAEYKKAENIISEFLGDNADKPIVINEKPTGLTFKQVFQGLLKQLENLSLNCLSHGDCRADNIIVSPNNKLVFIDMRPGFFWLDDLILLCWQDNFRMVKFLERPAVENKNGNLHIGFTVDTSASLKIVENKYSDFPHLYFLTAAVSNICEIAGVLRRKQMGILDRELLSNTEYFWVAKAVENFLCL